MSFTRTVLRYIYGGKDMAYENNSAYNSGAAHDKAKAYATKKVKRNVKKKVKRLNFLTLVICILALAAGIAAGAAGCLFVCRNDCFELNGKKEYVVEAGESFVYRDEGVRIVEFGRDISDRVQIKTNLTKNDDGSYSPGDNASGSYYIIYTVDSVRYGKIQRVRTITAGGEN